MKFELPETQSAQSKPETNLPTVGLNIEKLPSRNLAYPKNCEISYTPYSLGEVKQISKSKNMSTKDRIHKIASGIICTGHSVKDLTVPDLTYIGMLRQISTLGTPKVVLNYVCAKCGEKGRHIVDVQNDLEFDDLLIKYGDEASLPIEGEFSFGVVQFRPLTVKQYLKMLQNGQEHDEIAKLANESNLPFDEAVKKFSDTKNVTDMRLLDAIDRLLFHGLKPIRFECKNKEEDGSTCGNRIAIELDGGQALLLPFRESNDDIENLINIGSKVKYKSD